MNNESQEPETDEKDALPDDMETETNPFEDDEIGDIDADNVLRIDGMPPRGKKAHRKPGTIPKKIHDSRMPRLAFGTLEKTRSTLSRLTKRYAAGKMSETEYRAMVYGMRALSQMHVSERIGRVERDTEMIKAFLRDKGIEL